MALTAGVAAWVQGAVKTTASAPSMGQINRYNTTAGPLTVTLPALSGLNIGARTLVQKDTLDVSANTVTFNRAGSDQFDDGSTGFTLTHSGESRTLQVVSISGVKRWKVTEAMGESSGGGGSGGGGGINVKDDYGAVGNGSTNDTAAIQAALDAATAAGGGTVFLPPGTYSVANLSIDSNTTLEGAGKLASTLKLRPSSTGNVLASENFATLVGTTSGGGVTGVAVRNLSVDGNKSGSPSGGYGIALYGPDFLVEDVNIHHCHGHGIVLDYAGGTVIPLESCLNRVKVFNGDADGFHVLGAHDSTAFECFAAENAGTGFYAGGGGWNWTDCHAWGTQQYAWHLSGTNHLTNCQGEGASISNFFIDWHQATIIGGASFFPNDAAATGMSFAATVPLPKNIIVQGMRFYDFSSASGASLDLTNLGAQSSIVAMIDQASGTAITGSPPADAYVNVQVGGGSSTPSIFQVPGYTLTSAGTEVRPAPALYDSFTATDGTALDSAKWTVTTGGAGAAAATTNGNRARLTAGATGGYAAADRVFVVSTLPTSLADVELLVRHTFGNTSIESYTIYALRSSTTDPQASSSNYSVLLGNSNFDVYKYVSGTKTSFSAPTYTSLGLAAPTTNGIKWVRFRAKGTQVALRMWDDGGAEPSGWTYSTTDSSVTAGGRVVASISGGNAASSGVNYFDQAHIYAL